MTTQCVLRVFWVPQTNVSSKVSQRSLKIGNPLIKSVSDISKSPPTLTPTFWALSLCCLPKVFTCPCILRGGEGINNTLHLESAQVVLAEIYIDISMQHLWGFIRGAQIELLGAFSSLFFNFSIFGTRRLGGL